MAKTNTTARTIERLRREGYTAANVERFYGGVSHDLFNCIDILAMSEDELIGIQCTTVAHQSERMKKIQAEPMMKTWIIGGRRLQVWGWAKKGPRGKRKLWEVTITEVTLEMLD